MLISRFYMNNHFKWHQSIGAGCILLGAISASMPFFFSSVNIDSKIFISILVFFISILPASMSNVYKEEKMKVSRYILVCLNLIDFDNYTFCESIHRTRCVVWRVWDIVRYLTGACEHILKSNGEFQRGAISIWLFWDILRYLTGAFET